MILAFLDRSREVARLQRAVASEHGAFCCLYGRRRCGKSRLLQEALRRGAMAYYAADEREAPLQRAALAEVMSTLVPGMEQVVYPEWASLLERWWREAPAGSVLVLDEFPYLVSVSAEVPSLLQKLLDRHPPRGVHLVICGSSQRMMQGLVLDGSAPLYGRAREILNIRPLGALWVAEALNLARPIDVVAAYAVWGGVPRYWELAAESASLWDAVRELVLNPLGVLHGEPRRLLMDDLRDTVQAASILALVGTGCTRLSEMASRLAKPATSLARPIQRLLELGLLRRDAPFGAPERGGKRALYSIADPFLAFWFRYVEPNRSRLEAGLLPQVSAVVQADFPTHAGAIWEVLVREAFARLRVQGLDWMPAARWWGPGSDRRPLEVDVVAASADGAALFVGEVKLRVRAADVPRLRQELEEKCRRLPFAHACSRLVTAIVAAEVEDGEPPEGVITAGEVLQACK